MRHLFAAALAPIACFLAGCATPYASSGYTGGYSESPVNDRLVKVTFSGNGYIDSDRVQAFALYRCAEVAREAKKPYFLLYDSLLAAARGVPSRQPRVGTLGNKPMAFAFVSLEDQYQPGAIEVQEILTTLGPDIDHGADTRRNR